MRKNLIRRVRAFKGRDKKEQGRIHGDLSLQQKVEKQKRDGKRNRHTDGRTHALIESLRSD